MVSRDQGLRDLATRLIDKRGRTLTLVRSVRADPPNTEEPWIPDGEDLEVNPLDNETNITVRGVVIPVNRALIDGTLVRVNDKTVYLSSQDVGDIDITLKDTIVDKGRKFRIVEVTDISPGEQRILFILQVRG